MVASLATGRYDLRVAISDVRSEAPDRFGIQEVLIARPDGTPLLRRRSAEVNAVLAPLGLFPDFFGNWHVRWGLARWPRRRGEQGIASVAVSILLEYSSLRPPQAGSESAVALRGLLDQAIDDPALPASGQVFRLVPVWFQTLGRTASAQDLETLSSLVRDRRITGFDQLVASVSYPIPPTLRGPIVERLADGEPNKADRRALNQLLARMPAGTFAAPTRTERWLLQNPAVRQDAPALVERLADRGRAAAPLLASLLAQTANAAEGEGRRDLLSAIRSALIQLGPEAQSELSTVDSLVRSRELAYTPLDADEWRFALARMGRPIEATSYPPLYSSEQLTREKADLRRRLVEYQARRPAR
jgi:hypothetical protein